MRFEETVPISTTADKVWATWLDIGHWPEWTTTVTSAERLEPSDGFGIGTRVLIKQPKMRPAVWEVTRVEPDRSFVWATRTGGIHMVADHTVEPSSDGVRVHLSLDLTGPASGLFGRLAARRIRDYLRTEAAGIRSRCET